MCNDAFCADLHKSVPYLEVPRFIFCTVHPAFLFYGAHSTKLFLRHFYLFFHYVLKEAFASHFFIRCRCMCLSPFEGRALCCMRIYCLHGTCCCAYFDFKGASGGRLRGVGRGPIKRSDPRMPWQYRHHLGTWFRHHFFHFCINCVTLARFVTFCGARNAAFNYIWVFCLRRMAFCLERFALSRQTQVLNQSPPITVNNPSNDTDTTLHILKYRCRKRSSVVN